MSLGENLVFLRKKQNMTQEELAEKLSVSRQSISKWESDTSYPEMDKLVQVCNLFECSMDTLLRGDVENNYEEAGSKYDAHMNLFSRQITGGVATVIWGVVVMMLLECTNVFANSSLPVVIFMLFLIAGVMIFVVSGLWHDAFVKKYPLIQNFYTEEQIDAFDKKFPILMVVPIAIILFGVVIVVAADELPIPAGFTEGFYTAVFLIFVAIAAPILVYGGIQKSKYDLEEYNRSQSPNQEQQEKNDKVGKWSGVIMLLAVAIYLFTGFAWGMWGVTWYVFPIGGILCGVAAVLIGSDKKA